MVIPIIHANLKLDVVIRSLGVKNIVQLGTGENYKQECYFCYIIIGKNLFFHANAG